MALPGADWFARVCFGLTVIVVAAGFVAGIFAAIAGEIHVVRVGARRVVIELGAGFGGGMNIPYFGLGVAILFGVLSIWFALFGAVFAPVDRTDERGNQWAWWWFGG